MLLRGRKWKITVGGIDVTELDVEFNIRKSLRREPNTCSLEVHNLSKEHRGYLEQLNIYDPKKLPGAKAVAKKAAAVAGFRAPKPGRISVSIEAGYEDGTSLLFRGDLRRAVSKRSGPGYVTSLEGEDGGRSVLAARVSRTLPAGTPVLVAVKACADAMGLGYGNILEVTPELSRSFGSGSVIDGQAATELDGILRRLGLRYSVQNGVLQFLRNGKGADSLKVRAVVLSKATGLVGAPERDATGELMATSLLIPNIAPGGYVVLATEAYQGLYHVTTVEHVGSTFATDWYHKLWLEPG